MDNQGDSGRLPDGTGLLPTVEPVPVSPLRAAIPSADAFREAVIDELVVSHIYTAKHDADPRLAIHDAIAWNVAVALDPQVSASAQDLLDQGRADGMRDASRFIQQMCGAIGALPGSSIHSALSACWEKMDEMTREISDRRAER